MKTIIVLCLLKSWGGYTSEYEFKLIKETSKAYQVETSEGHKIYVNKELCTKINTQDK